MMISMSCERINIIVENSHDFKKIGREKKFAQNNSDNSITTNTGLLSVSTMLLHTVLTTLSKFGSQRTMYKITGTITDMSKNGVN